MILVAAGIAACADRDQSEAPLLVGAWRIVETTTPDGTVNPSPQPSLYIFADRHYSMVRVIGSEARPLLADTATRSTITDAEMRTIFMPFVSNSGTYELQGSTLVNRPTVSLWPNFMAGGSDTSEISLAGDTLRITQRSGAAANARWTLIRQE
jgi:hypothetical protein